MAKRRKWLKINLSVEGAKGTIELPDRSGKVEVGEPSGRPPIVKVVKPSPPIEPPLKHPDERPYLTTEVNTAAFRGLLIAAFDDSELDHLCFDHFPEVHHRFGSGASKDQKIQLLLQHCKSRIQWNKLIDVVRETNPSQYRRFEPQLFSGV